MSSSADRLILNAVVNPMLPLGEGVFDDQESLPVGLQDDEMDTDGVRLVIFKIRILKYRAKRVYLNVSNNPDCQRSWKLKPSN